MLDQVEIPQPVEKPAVRLAELANKECISVLDDGVKLKSLFYWKGSKTLNKRGMLIEDLPKPPPEWVNFMLSLPDADRGIITNVIGVAFRAGFEDLKEFRQILQTGESTLEERLKEHNIQRIGQGIIKSLLKLAEVKHDQSQTVKMFS